MPRPPTSTRRVVRPASAESWFQQAVFYAIDVGSFRDSNEDGYGDLRGVAESLAYLQRLGVDAIWLLPFYTTPNRDNGYDVSDYFAIDPRYGTFGDFVDLIDEARLRGIRVVVDLVVNHTSNEHPWFRSARKGLPNRFRDYYIWSDSPPPPGKQPKSIFSDRVPVVWTWDESAASYYYHQFYPFQPALNHFNPRVRDEVRRIIAFWLRLGVAGFRVDAAPHLISPPLPGGPQDPIDILRDYRRQELGAKGDAILVGEADVPPDQLANLMGDDALQLLFNFMLNGHFFLAMARGSADPIVKSMRAIPDVEGATWANFLRNLDEVDLERLSPSEQQEVFARFAPDPESRIYGRGIRRRLAPMLGGDRRRLELAYAILLSLPGSPVIVYGDEIGMGDDLSLPERTALRTAMQWSRGPTGGFSDADDVELGVPLIRDGAFGLDRVNVHDQEREPGSLLSWLTEAIRVRRYTPELLLGSDDLRSLGHGSVLARTVEDGHGPVVALHNLSDRPVTLSRRQIGAHDERFRTLLAPDDAQPLPGDARGITLEPCGYRWLRLETPGDEEGPAGSRR